MTRSRVKACAGLLLAASVSAQVSQAPFQSLIPLDAPWLATLGANACALVDIDGDGDLDLFAIRALPWVRAPIPKHLEGLAEEETRLATAHEMDGQSPIVVYRNDGSGAFTESTARGLESVDWTACGCAWNDADRDGDPDLLIWGDGRTSLYRNLGGMTFESVPIADAAGAEPIVPRGRPTWCHVDGDEWVDIAILGAAGVTVVRNEGGERFSLTPPPDGGSESPAGWVSALLSGHAGCDGGAIAAADFDHDGDDDLVLAPWMPGGGFGVGLNRGDLVFERSEPLSALVPCSVETEPSAACFTDLNGDGWKDLVVSSTAPPGLPAHQWVFHASGHGDFNRGLSLDAIGLRMQSSGCLAGDLDGDGDHDLVFLGNANWFTGIVENLGEMRFRMVRHRHATSAEGAKAPWLPTAGCAALGDIDGDGDPDLLLADSFRSSLYLNPLR
jgi:hypothetical protein